MATTVLRERMVRVLRARNYSPRTIQAYVSAVARFARHFGKSPDQLGPAQVTEFQLWLREHQKISASLFNQIVSALRFLYGEVLGRWDVVKRIAFARHERRLPVVLSREETVRFLASIDVPLYRVLLTTIYSAGLRLTEALTLRASDIDSSRMLIRIRQGKGKKDRYVPLSPVVLDLLREHWRRHHLRDLLFPSEDDPSRPLHTTTVQKRIKRFASRSGLGKRITAHTLRHSYATHLIEKATSPRVVQVLLGHASVHTTETYLHVSPQAMAKATSPLDEIAAQLPPLG